MLWTILDKFLAALTAPMQIADTKRITSESDPVRDQWAAECELGLVHLAEKAAEMANEVIISFLCLYYSSPYCCSSLCRDLKKSQQ